MDSCHLSLLQVVAPTPHLGHFATHVTQLVDQLLESAIPA